MKVYVDFLGCKVNSYETEFIKEAFLNNGYQLVDVNENPNIIVINTCTVTNNAESKSRKIIHHARRINSDAILVVVGCMTQGNQDFDDADIILGNKDKSKILDYINEYLKSKKKIKKFYDLKSQEFETMKLNNFESKTRAFIKIQDGCNNFCSYCIIPYVRGNIRSKSLESVLEETNNLVTYGHREVVLTGIHTSKYGIDIKSSLTELLKEMSKITELERIRISSVEVTELDDNFINLLKENNKICNHLHIPLQSGSDKILKLMNRKYNKEEYLNIINKIRNVRPDINITTDLIVGFPNETEEDFNETLDFLKKVGYSKIHVFPFSERKYTKAALMDNKLSNDIKKIRVHEVMKLSDELERIYYSKFINTYLTVLIETTNNNESIGHTSNYMKVIINENLIKNKIYNVKIIKICQEGVIGIVNAN